MFSCKKTKKLDILGAHFTLLSIISPWSCSLVATKFYRKLVAINGKFHFKFCRNPSIFRILMNKKLIFFCFTGPFWAFLGTPNNTYHHDSFFFSLSYQEVFPPKNLECWDLIKQKILTKNSQNMLFLAVFLGAFLGAPS